jgi:hypothetical protein
MHIRVKVSPRSKKDEVTGQMDDGTIKISVKAPPERGKANEAVIETLASYYGVKKAQIRIISGFTDPIKLIRIDEPTS